MLKVAIVKDQLVYMIPLNLLLRSKVLDFCFLTTLQTEDPVPVYIPLLLSIFPPLHDDRVSRHACTRTISLNDDKFSCF